MAFLDMNLTGSELYIYGFGLTGKWLSANLSGNVRGFIETDEKKVGRSINGIPVISLDQARRTLTQNSEILVTVVDIQDVIPAVESLPHSKWLALGLYLNATKVILNPTEETNEFIEYAIKAVEDCHKAYFSRDAIFLRSIDLIITEKCSLKCRDCSNLMQYYRAPVNIGYEELVRDFDLMVSAVDRVHEIRLIGGEPFMNKDIYKILRHICGNPKISQIVVYSNATIPFKESEIDILRHPKLVFSLTDYGGLARNTPKVVESLKAMGVTYRLHPPENWTDSGTIFHFERDVPELERLFSDCCGKNLLTVTDGKIYRCPFAANADRLQAIPHNPANSVSLDAGRDAIKHYTTSISYLPACDFCKGRSFGAPEIEPAIQAPVPLQYRHFARYET